MRAKIWTFMLSCLNYNIYWIVNDFIGGIWAIYKWLKYVNAYGIHEKHSIEYKKENYLPCPEDVWRISEKFLQLRYSAIDIIPTDECPPCGNLIPDDNSWWVVYSITEERYLHYDHIGFSWVDIPTLSYTTENIIEDNNIEFPFKNYTRDELDDLSIIPVRNHYEQLITYKGRNEQPSPLCGILFYLELDHLNPVPYRVMIGEVKPKGRLRNEANDRFWNAYNSGMESVMDVD